MFHFRFKIKSVASFATCGAFAVLGLTACDGTTRHTSADARSNDASRPACNMAWSREVAEKARTTPMVRDLAVRRDGLHIIVNPAAWSILKLDERDRLVSAFDCAIAGPNYLNAAVVEDPRGRPLKTYGPVDLYDARSRQP